MTAVGAWCAPPVGVAKGLITAVTNGLDRERLLCLVRDFAGKRILVVGDLVADEYIIGAPLLDRAHDGIR